MRLNGRGYDIYVANKLTAIISENPPRLDEKERIWLARAERAFFNDREFSLHSVLFI